MIYFTFMLSTVCIVTFSVQFVITLQSKIDKFLKANIAIYFIILILWELTGIGIIITENKVTAELLYRFYAVAATGFVFTALPLSFAITGHKKKKIAALFSLIFFAANLVINIAFNTIENLYSGSGGFYIPVFNNLSFYFNLPSFIFLILTIIFSVILIRNSNSSIIRQRMYYFLAANILIFSGLISNLTPFKDYPVDIICTMLGGLLLAYAILKNRLLNIRKTFFRGAFFSTLAAAATGLYILLLYIISVVSGYVIPYFAVIPALITYLLILAGYSRKLTTMNKILFRSNSIYIQSLEKYKKQTANLQAFDLIFRTFHNTLSKDFLIEKLTVHMLDKTEGDFILLFSKPDSQTLNIPMVIEKKDPLMSSLKHNEILIFEEFYNETSTRLIPYSLKTIYGDSPPDIILPIKISGEIIGIIIFNFFHSQHFIDKEDIAYIIEINRLTTEAVTRGYAYEQLEQEVFKSENLIKDINHRVKNNLQMISGLLSLQSLSVENPEVISALKTAERRIQIIAKIHEMLYVRGVTETVNLKTYIEEVLKGFYTSGTSDDINISSEIVDIEVETEKALTICLIINELVANAVKYAYPSDSRGEIQIVINKKDEHTINCLISDKGIGCKETNKENTGTGIGHNLVNSFIKTQLKGTWEISYENGTSHHILIPLS